MPNDGDIPLVCHRCGRLLSAGKGDFYLVRIEAFADPSPPVISAEDLAAGGDLQAKIQSVIDQMKGMSQQELADQVYRRLTIHLCGTCYRSWIEDPAGNVPQ